MASRRMMVLILLVLIDTSANAALYTNSPEHSAGTGTEFSATIVVDFDMDSYFSFIYSWDTGETPTGWDAISAISGAGDLVVETAYGGTFITDLLYPGGVKYDYGSQNSGWAYYTSDDGDIWDYSLVGIADRILTDNAWDSWTWTSYSGGEYGWDNADRLPGGEPVPEPGTIALLGLGGLLLRKRKA